MSGVPKRSHEEGNVHSSSSSKYPHEDSGSYPKLTPPPLSAAAVQSEHHHHHLPHPHPHSHSPYELDSRIAKLPRPDSRDTDRRSPIHSAYRLPAPSSNDIHLTHPPVTEPRESKDVREIRGESRENKSEGREMYGEAKRDSQTAKAERDLKFENRGVEINKEIKFDKENATDQKSEVKVEMDVLGRLNWKDQIGKRLSEGSSGNVDPWHAPRGNSQVPNEPVKEFHGTEERACLEGHEAVGENKIELKNDDRFKDRDKKRKDVKPRDWGDRDKERIELNFQQYCAVVDESKESGREERDSDRLERERKEQKEQERLKERDKEQIKRDSWSGAEKEGSHNEKELGEASVKPMEQENLTIDQKKTKDTDSWKSADRDLKDKRREKDTDVEGERAEKRIKCNEKESDDGLTEGEGAPEREKELFNHGIQQRKRMLRPRGSPQMTNRDRFRSRTLDNEGSQGKPEVSSVVYKAGECVQELAKLWKGYESSHSDRSASFANNGPTLEVHIPAEHVTATNRQVRGGQLWGTDIYTDDSDLVAVLMHTGYCRPTASPPPPTILELRATIRVLPPQDCYQSKLRNNVRSRAWGAGIGCSYRVERCCIVKKGGGTIELEPCLTHSSTVEPTLAPMAVERSMTTRAAASNALRQQRFVREVTIQYNLCNEPWIKYSISIVADKGLKKTLFTSARLKKGEVLYLETHSCRYELCFSGEKAVKAAQTLQGQHGAETERSLNHHHHHPHLPNGDKTESDNTLIDTFRWSRCKKPLPQKLMRSIGIPLPPDHVEVLEENLDWEDVQWSQTGVWIAGKEYVLARVHFLSAN